MAPAKFVLKQANVLDERGGFSDPDLGRARNNVPRTYS